MVEHKSYFGARSCNCPPEEDVKYMSSSKLIKKLYKEKPHEFKKKILKTFDTRKEAVEWEIYLHSTYDVGRNPSFYNKSKQTSIGFDNSGVISPNRIVYISGQPVGTYGVTFVKESPVLNKYGKRVALFKCKCGKEFNSVISAINIDYVKSCGCIKEYPLRGKYYPGELIGDYGVKYISDAPSKPGNRKANLLCACGKEFIACLGTVKFGGTKSCGCRNLESIKKYKTLYTSGDIVGSNGVTYLQEVEVAGITSSYKRRALFKCSCGKEFIARPSSIKSNNTKSCGCAIRKRKIKEG